MKLLNTYRKVLNLALIIVSFVTLYTLILFTASLLNAYEMNRIQLTPIPTPIQFFGFHLLLLLGSCIVLLNTYDKRFDSLENFWIMYEKARNYEGAFFLILRSFNEDTTYLNRVTERHITRASDGFVQITDDYAETNWILVVSELIKAHGLPVFMGGDVDDTELTLKKEHFYVDSSLSNWIKNFEILADHSQAIIIFPELSSGLFEVELPYIRRKGLLGKTIFIMTPVYDGWKEFILSGREDDAEKKEDGTRPSRWDMIQREYLNKGISIPGYDPDGKIFTLNDSGFELHEGSLKSSEIAISIDRVILKNKKVNGDDSNFKDIFHQLVLQKNYTTPLSFKSIDNIPGYGYGFAKRRNLDVITVLTLLSYFVISLLIIPNPRDIINLGDGVILWILGPLMLVPLMWLLLDFLFDIL